MTRSSGRAPPAYSVDPSPARDQQPREPHHLGHGQNLVAFVGVNYIGACCGAVATHIREMAQALGKRQPDSRPWKLSGERPMWAFEYYRHDKA